MKWSLYGRFARDAGERTVHVWIEEGDTVRDALEALFEKHPEIRERATTDGDLAEFVHVVHNHTDVYHELGGLDTELAVGDQLALFEVAG